MTTDRDIEQMVAECRFITSADQEQRVLEDTCAAMPERSRISTRRTPLSNSGRRLAVVAALALLILMVLFLRDNPHAAIWAQVQKSVAEQEWILIRGKTSDGVSFESWSSVPFKIDTSRNGKNIRFVNYKTGIQEYYDAEQQTITRSILSRRDNWDKQQEWTEIFNAIASGEESVKSSSPMVEIVSQNRRRTERDGKQWIEFEMEIQGSGQEDRARMVFWVDPESHLIQSMKLLNGAQQMSAEFLYPDMGPRSIYDLHVPKSAKVVDLIPSRELLALIDGVQSSAEEFGPYVALNVMQDPEAPWYVGTPFKVWADGNKVRSEYGLVNPDRDTFQKPDLDADQKHWWSRRWGQLWHRLAEVCDGESQHSNNAVPEGWSEARDSHPLTWDPKNWPDPEWNTRKAPDWSVAGSPLTFAYSPHLNRAGMENVSAEVDTSPGTGPEGTVLITLKHTQSNPQDISENRFWIDPEKSHLVMQIEYLSGNADSTSRTIITNREVARSPRGIWYPTLVSHKTITENDGQKTEEETLTRHYLDFDTEFPEGVFEPKPLPKSR